MKKILISIALTAFSLPAFSGVFPGPTEIDNARCIIKVSDSTCRTQHYNDGSWFGFWVTTCSIYIKYLDTAGTTKTTQIIFNKKNASALKNRLELIDNCSSN